MLARFHGELAHEVRRRIRKGLIVEFDQVKNAGDVGKIERQFKMFGAQMLTDGAAFYRLIVKTEFLTCESKRVGLDILLFLLR